MFGLLIYKKEIVQLKTVEMLSTAEIHLRWLHLIGSH